MADQLAASQAFLAEFWSGQDTSPEAIAAHVCPPSGGLPPQTWPERVQAYLEGALDLSDAELRRCTQGSDLLFHLAVVFREAGMLSRTAVEEIEAEAAEKAYKAGRKPCGNRRHRIGCPGGCGDDYFWSYALPEVENAKSSAGRTYQRIVRRSTPATGVTRTVKTPVTVQEVSRG